MFNCFILYNIIKFTISFQALKYSYLLIYEIEYKTYIYIYIWIYIERERQRDRQTERDTDRPAECVRVHVCARV